MESPWEKWKKNNVKKQESGLASPLDFFNPETEYVSETQADERYSVCESCPYFLTLTKQCRKCGCFMHIKTKLAHAECPIGKWGAISQR